MARLKKYKTEEERKTAQKEVQRAMKSIYPKYITDSILLNFCKKLSNNLEINIFLYIFAKMKAYSPT